MKNFYYMWVLSLFVVLTTACENKKTCPACWGRGEFIFGGRVETCLTCMGEKTLSEEAYQRAVNQLQRMGVQVPEGGGQPVETMVVCPICNGSGRYNSQDLFMSQMACTGCSGHGMVPSSQLMNIMQMHTPSVPPASSSGGGRQHPATEVCFACQGSGACTVCDGMGETSYYGHQSPCSHCYTSGDCPTCMGTGLLPR